MAVTLRAPVPADKQSCGRIMYEAFHDIATRHAFPPDFDSPDQTTQFAGMMIPAPNLFGVVAEQDGRVIGSNFLWEADPIRGVGPITVDLAAQGSGIGRRLMQAVIERSQGAAGVRLVQDAFNTRSMSLYASLGFEIKEPLALMQGRPKSEARREAGLVVRPMEPGDVEGCVELCRRVHGFDRRSELRPAGQFSQPWVAVRDGRVAAYATALNNWVTDHGVAESQADMEALILGFAAARQEAVWFLLPIRQAEFFRWCLKEGLRVVKPMNLMAMGEYQEPQGCWFPSVMY